MRARWDSGPFVQRNIREATRITITASRAMSTARRLPLVALGAASRACPAPLEVWAPTRCSSRRSYYYLM